MKANETNFIALIRQKREEGKKLFPRPLLCIMAGEQQSFLFQRINIFHIITTISAILNVSASSNFLMSSPVD